MPDLEDRSTGVGLRGPTVQGVYDALRGGRHHLRPDKRTAVALEKAFPGTGAQMLEERAFGLRAAAWAAEGGIRQFIVAGAGMPAPPGQNIHEAAQAVLPGAATVYACAHPYAAAWSRALLAEGDPLVTAIEGHVRNPGGILAHPGLTDLVDLARPVFLAIPMVLHFVPPARAREILRAFTAPLAPGSTVAVSAWENRDPVRSAEFSRLFAARPVVRHQAARISRWMSGAGLRMEPRGTGVVDARLWPHRVWAAGELPARPTGRIAVAVGVLE